MKKIAFFILTFRFLSVAYCQETPDEAHKKRIYPALLEGLSVNLAFHLTGRAMRAAYAQTNLESIKTNLTSLWIWDDDAFLYNNPGHPYQGSLYYIASRTNGFTFYESMIFNALGSLTWELFGESDLPAFNDFFAAFYGGLTFGEIFHRLYLEFDSLFAILISPMDAVNNLIMRKRATHTNNLYYFSTMIGAAWIESGKYPGTRFSDYAAEKIAAESFSANIGFDIIYGDSYIQPSKTPFDQFEMYFRIGRGFFTYPWFDLIILTDGYLFSVNPLVSEDKALSTGISLNYDLLVGSNTSFAASSLSYSLKWRYNFTNTQFSIKLHLGWILCGSSRYYPDSVIEESPFNLGYSCDNFGTGVNAKLSFSVSNRKLGDFNLFIFPQFLYVPSWIKKDSQGWEIFSLLKFEYWYKLTERFSIGLCDSFCVKSGKYINTKDIIEQANSLMFNVKWIFIENNETKINFSKRKHSSSP